MGKRSNKYSLVLGYLIFLISVLPFICLGQNCIITSEPTDKTACEGSDVEFKVVVQVNNSVNPTYEWKVSNNNGNSFSNAEFFTSAGTILGANSNILRISSLPAAANELKFKVIVSGEDGDDCYVESNIVTLNLRVGSIENARVQSVGEMQLTCEVDEVIVEVVNTTGSDIEYNWQGNGEAITGEPSKRSFKNKGEDYRVIVSNTCDSKSESFDINEDVTKPIANAGVDQQITMCDEQINLSGRDSNSGGNDGSLTYQWYQGSVTDANKVPNGARQNISVMTAGIYILEVANEISNCKATDEVRVTENNINRPTAQINAPITQIDCDNTSITLNGSSSTGQGTLFYTWFKDNNQVGNSETFQTANPGAYTLVVRDDTNCNSQSSMSVILTKDTEPPLISVMPDTNNIKVCQGDLLEFTASGTDVSFEWTYGTSSESTATLTRTSDEVGFVQYKLTGTDNSNGCSSTRVLNVTTEATPMIMPIDPIIINAGEDNNINIQVSPPNAIVEWVVNSTPDNISTGYADGGTGTNIGETYNLLSDKQVGNIAYLIQAISPSGTCSSSESVSIKVFPPSLKAFIPEVFTPNNDGVNDAWNLSFNDQEKDYDIHIYDRYGRIVTVLNGARTWRGDNCPNGTYYYVIYDNGEEIPAEMGGQGAVTIMGRQE